MSKALVVGFGSIGKRHARLLTELGHTVAVVSGQGVAEYRCFSTLAAALAEFGPGYVVIASVTSRHQDDLAALADHGFAGTALVEKPLFMTRPEPVPTPGFPVFVAYNLRFHPVARALKAALAGKRVLCAHALVGQHLSQWRPGRDVSATYSAHRRQGGGVARDLSHEYDFATFLFGAPELLAGHSARVGEVTVDSEDVAAAILATPGCPVVTIQLNYLDRTPRRQWTIVAEDETIEADLVRGTLTRGGQIQPIPMTPDDSYRAMHQAALAGETGLCTWQEGLAVVAMTDKVAPL